MAIQLFDRIKLNEKIFQVVDTDEEETSNLVTISEDGERRNFTEGIDPIELIPRNEYADLRSELFKRHGNN